MSPLRRLLIGAAVAILAGLAIAIVDSRPGWDDTGITVALLIASSALAAFMMPARAGWAAVADVVLVALLTGLWVPLLELSGASGPAPLIALVFTTLGATCGAIAARSIRPIDRRADRDHDRAARGTPRG